MIKNIDSIYPLEIYSIFHTNIYSFCVGGGWGLFLRWWSPSTMWAGPLIFLYNHRECVNNPIFSNLRLCAACWTCFMCNNELWPTLVSHPFSSLIALDLLLEEKITKKLLSLSLGLFFKILLFQVAFLIFISIAIFSFYFLLVGLLYQYMALFQSGN